jgi:NADPH:quinone reductase-like Zn-dependent oxidoreductase
MRAIVQDGYGSPEDVLHLGDIDRPVVADDEVLVRVRAASVHPDVWHVVSGRPALLRLMGSGLRRPKQRVPGTDLAGIVESVGDGVTRFRPGDEVFGETIRGYQWRNGGTFAEYATAPQEGLARKPAGVTFEQAAAVPTSGLIALLNLQQGRLAAGQNVLVNGAAGGVGAIALQIAKARGATVTGVDSTAKLELVRSLGADRVIDYTREDFTRGQERYDLVFDVPGGHRLADCRRVLTPDGMYVLIGHDHYGRVGRKWLGSLPYFVGLMARSLLVKQLPKPTFSMPGKQEQLAVLTELLETGRLTPVIGATYPLDEVPEAMRRLAAGDTLGKIIISV